MTWTQFPCIDKWTFTDNEATGFTVLEAGTVFLLSIDTFPLLYGTIINPISSSSFTARVFSDEAKTTEVIMGDYTAKSYILSRFSGWVWSPLLFDGTLDPEGIGTWRSRIVRLYISGGRLDGIWITRIRVDGGRTTRFSGIFTPFPLAVIGLTVTAFTDTGTLPAGTYTYYVSAVDSSGREGGASWREVTLGATGRVVLSWFETPDAVSYNIYRDCQLLEGEVVPIDPENPGYEDDGTQPIEDPDQEPSPDPDPAIPPPAEPPIIINPPGPLEPPADPEDPSPVDPEDPIIIIIRPNPDEPPIVIIDIPDVEIINEDSTCENDIYTDLEGNDVVITRQAGEAIEFERLGNGRWSEETGYAPAANSIEDIYTIIGKIQPPDYDTIIAAPVTWEELLTDNTKVGVYKVEPNEDKGVTFPLTVKTTGGSQLKVHYNSNASTISVDSSGEVEVPHVFGIRAIEKDFTAFTDIRNLYLLTEFPGETTVPAIPAPITIHIPGGPGDSRIELTDWDRPESINMRVTLDNSPGAGVTLDGHILGGYPSNPAHFEDLSQASPVKTFSVDDVDFFTNISSFAMPDDNADVDIIWEAEGQAIPAEQIDFSIDLFGRIFELNVRDSVAEDELVAVCTQLNYIDTYIPPGSDNSFGDQLIIISDEISNPIVGIPPWIQDIIDVFTNPGLIGYQDLPEYIGAYPVGDLPGGGSGSRPPGNPGSIIITGDLFPVPDGGEYGPDYSLTPNNAADLSDVTL